MRHFAKTLDYSRLLSLRNVLIEGANELDDEYREIINDINAAVDFAKNRAEEKFRILSEKAEELDKVITESIMNEIVYQAINDEKSEDLKAELDVYCEHFDGPGFVEQYKDDFYERIANLNDYIYDWGSCEPESIAVPAVESYDFEPVFDSAPHNDEDSDDVSESVMAAIDNALGHSAGLVDIFQKMNIAQAVIAADRAERPVVVPEGYAIVPSTKEGITEYMANEGVDAGFTTFSGTYTVDPLEAYLAMVAAAPPYKG